MQILNSQKGIFNTIFIIVILLMLFNIFLLKSVILGLILGVLWLFGAVTGVLGAKFAANQPNLYQKATGLIAGLGLIILISSLFFYLFNFNSLAIISSYLIISGIIFYLILKFDIKPKFQKNIVKFDHNIIIYLILFILALFILFYNQTNQAIRSPWEAVPALFFIIYFLAAIFLLKTKNLILLSLHFFLTFIIAVIIYKIGYGFDPFVHRAAEYKLAELGYILPKPFYYIGQYTLVVFLSKIFFVPINLIDKILVPLLAAITLPVIGYYSLNKFVNNKNLLLIAYCLLLIAVTPLFFYTVPQSLANLFLLILIFLLFSNTNKWLVWFLVIVIFLIHPLAGIPALILAGVKNFKKLFYILASILIPLFFILGSLISNFKIKFGFNNFSNLRGLFENIFSYLPFYSVYHLIYLIKYNFLILFILILLIAVYYFKKGIKYILISSVILIINLILLSFFEFKAVIDYEQAEFVKRLGQIILLALAPIFLLGIYFILEKINNLKAGRYIIIVLAAGILTIGLYLNYPHVDAFEKNRGYSVSEADIEAVRLINLDGGDRDFIVLSNQSTAAASLQEFGFKKYYKKCQSSNVKCQNLFYYPIPTSSSLYEIYLKMIYNGPSLEYINQAQKLTGVARIYFVINDYWLDAKKRVGQARAIADEEFNIDDKIWVFRFE